MRISKRFLFIFVPFFIASGALAYMLSVSIATKHNETERIKNVDAQVIYKLKQIREMQIVYMEEFHEYAANWDTLIDFSKNGQLHLTQRSEQIITRPYGGDSIVVTVDTIGVKKASEVLLEKAGLAVADMDSIKIVPVSGDTFSIYANRLEGAWLFEVKDEKPLNPKRQKKGGLKPLRIGSRVQSTTKGNWE